MDRLESRIRDYLAANVTLIEPGLALVQKEFPLPNPAGAGGAIDILARDVLGHYVVIEIKRSDQAARAALHELTKYSALLKATLGIRADQIRALLLSTDWRELAVPFAEYQRVCEVPTGGLVISAAPSGAVTSVTPFVPPHLDQSLSISRQQHVFLFASADRRDACISKLIAAARRARIADAAILAVEYTGENRRIIFRHGAYFVFSSPPQSRDDDPVREADDDVDAALMERWLQEATFERDDSEIGYPEKLAALMSSGWGVSVAARLGRYAANRALLADDQLITEVAKLDGGANYYLFRTASPMYAPSWEKLKEDARIVVLGNTAWFRALFQMFERLEREHSGATVSVSLYNPANIVLSLVKLFSTGEHRYLPSFQVVETFDDRVDLYLGMLVWNGVQATLRGREWIERAYGSMGDYSRMQHFHQQHERDEVACALLGLSSVVLHVEYAGTAQQKVNVLQGSTGNLRSEPLADSKAGSMAEFCTSNIAFGRSLVEDIAAASHGWVS